MLMNIFVEIFMCSKNFYLNCLAHRTLLDIYMYIQNTKNLYVHV